MHDRPVILDAIRRAAVAGGARRAILVGSYARGTATPRSDIDVVFVEDTSERFLDRPDKYLRSLWASLGQPVDVLVYTAAEKALEATWIGRGGDPWGHSVTRLVAEFPDPAAAETMRRILDAARRLDKLYVPTRYPNGLPDLIPAEVYTGTEAREAMDAAATILHTVAGLAGLP
jgi:HEPN domain-containing protein